MKTISADPEPVTETSDSNSEFNSELNSELEFSELDRSVEVIDSPVPLSPDGRSSKTKRYPSFRDMFLYPLRGRKLSSSDDARPKRKDKTAGCAGWLRKTSSADLSDTSECDDCPELIQISSTPVPSRLQCSHCQQVFDGMPSGMTYTKREAPDVYMDDNWFCAQCLHVLKNSHSDVEEEDFIDTCNRQHLLSRVPHSLAYLAMDVLKINVSYEGSPSLYSRISLCAAMLNRFLPVTNVIDSVCFWSH